MKLKSLLLAGTVFALSACATRPIELADIKYPFYSTERIVGPASPELLSELTDSLNSYFNHLDSLKVSDEDLDPDFESPLQRQLTTLENVLNLISVYKDKPHDLTELQMRRFETNAKRFIEGGKLCGKFDIRFRKMAYFRNLGGICNSS